MPRYILVGKVRTLLEWADALLTKKLGDGWMDGWTEWMDMDGWTRWMDGWMDGYPLDCYDY